MVVTNKFDLTKKEYFRVLLSMLIKRNWWKFLFLWLLALLISFKNDKDSLDLFFIIFLFSYPLLMIFEYWRFANSKDNRKIFGERYYEISTDEINAFLFDGSKSTIKFNHFVKTFELKDYFFIYISKSQSLYFPKRIFKSKDDLEWFKENIFNKVKLNK